MTIERIKNRYLELILGSAPQDEVDHACQLKTYKLNNNTPDGEVGYTFCSDPDDPDAGEYREDAEPSWSLAGTVLADWLLAGLSRWSHQHDGEWVRFKLHINQNDARRHVWWTGELKVKAVSVGGDARTDQTSDFEWQIKGKPSFYAASGLESDSN